MKKHSKLNGRIAKFLILVLTVTTVFFGIPPETVRAASPTDILYKLPDSKPGDLVVNWYSARRYIPGQEPKEGLANIAGTYLRWMENLVWPPVNRDDSDAALQNYDTSVFLQKDKKSDLTFDMTKWQPDHEYWITWQDPEYNFETNFKSLYNWTWCEVNGFIKIPDKGYLGYVKIKPVRSDVTCDLNIRFNGNIRGGEFVPFHLRIKCPEPDQSNLNKPFSVVFQYDYYLVDSIIKRISRRKTFIISWN